MASLLGLWILFFATAILVVGAIKSTVGWLLFSLAIPLGGLGGLVCLAAVGEWGKWRYLWIIVFLPASLLGTVLLVSSFDQHAGLLAIACVLWVPAAAAKFALLRVQDFYNKPN